MQPVFGERSDMTTMRRIASIGALAVAAAAVPVLAALGSTGPLGSTGQTISADGTCLAWFGSRDDGQCLSYSNGQGVNLGTPSVGYGGPNSGSPGWGVTTGPLLPGQSISLPMG